MSLIRRAILAFALIAGITPAMAQVPPPVPALPDTERRTSYSITGSSCNCAVNFALYGDSTDYQNWVEVFVNGALVPASGNWTITSPSGSLANLPRPITDAVLNFVAPQTGVVQIVGARRPRRIAQFAENAGVSARNLNVAITDLVAQNREVWDKTNDVTGRAVLAPPGETLALLPALANRLNQGVCFNASGNLVPCVSIPSSTFIAGLGITFSGTNPTTIAINPTGTTPIVVDPTTKAITCPSCVTTNTTLTNVPTIAALKALPPPGTATVYVVGYATVADGGEGWFDYVSSSSVADNGGTVIQPSSLPATGRWIRASIGDNGKSLNVRWFGAKGDNATNDQTAITNAVTAAIASKGDLYFPATSGCYLAKITIPTGTVGLRIHGDTPAAPAATGGSCIASVDTTATIDLQSTLGGNTNTIQIDNLQAINSSGGGDAIRATNLIFFTMRNVVAVASGSVAVAAVHIIGVGDFNFSDVQGYGSSGLALKIESSASTGSGPGIITGGQFTVSNGSAASCVAVNGQASVEFASTQFSCNGPNMAAIVTIDGDGVVPQTGTVKITKSIGESNYNSTTNTGVDVLIGNSSAAGTVIIDGWNGGGQGDGTHFQHDSIRVVAARDVMVRGSTFTKGASTNGYDRGAIRLETTFPAAGNKYRFENNQATTSGTLYSDANGRVSSSYLNDTSWPNSALPKQTFSDLATCAAAIEGTLAAVSDSNTVVWGATVAGSSTNHILAYCDGTNWTVAGK